MSDGRQLRGDFVEIRTARNDVLERDADVHAHVANLMADVAGMAAGNAAFRAMNTAFDAGAQAALSAVAQMSARYQHQAGRLGAEADQLEADDLAHAQEAATVTRPITRSAP